MTALLHLIDPAQWRAALDAGAVRPPSLAGTGFVHLSTPEQVHLPAARLFPGRRDLVLLVVDPGRLTDPVRFEPGVPGDPAAMRFPHLYGPLPAAAVVAVVPYLPPAPPVLPAPDDALGRALAHALSLRTRRAAEVRDVPGGVAVLGSPGDGVRLLLSEPVEAATVEATAASIARDAAPPHLSAILRWPGAAAVAEQLAARGWSADEVVVLARPARPPLPAGARAQRLGSAHGDAAVVAVSDYAVPGSRGPVAAGRLRIDGATAALEWARPGPASRDRGHADAVLAAALDDAAAAGCDLVVAEAATDDRLHAWYAHRGFAEVGSVWEVGAGQAGTTQESSR